MSLSDLWRVSEATGRGLLLVISRLSLLLVILPAAAFSYHARDVNNTLLNDDEDGTDWPSYGRTFDETHFSPLRQINVDNVTGLGLAWSLDLDVTNSITAPLEINGVVYLGAGHGIVHAIDAKTGSLLWRYDAKAPEVAGRKMRVAWGIRGIAFWQGRVFAGTSDGRLIALNANDGTLAWSVQTVDPSNGATISGPPRVFNGKVVIGFAGEDFAPLRGYVTAYDTETGRLVWRFYTVPGKPGQKDNAASDDVMPTASKTWTGAWWKHGGGGAVWNSFTYDPKYNRLYFGTGNGDPMNWKIRSPGGGDNLFIASIIAVDADTGHYAWHYQTAPGDSWDYDSSCDMTLATLLIDGKIKSVLIHAAKNGFIYVIDRQTGKLLSAEKLGTVTWADHVDLATGRPVRTAGADYKYKPILMWPSFQAVHHWLPQSFSTTTGLAYVPTLEMPARFGDMGVDKKHWMPKLETPDYTGLSFESGDVPVDAGRSILKAWNPIDKKLVWQVETPGVSNGGTLATAGDLVFQGLADGYFHAYHARNGGDLWSFFAGVAATGVPITYSVDGVQYVTITAGPLGGSTAGFGAISARWGWDPRIHPRRLLTFTLGAKTPLPPTPPRALAVPLYAPEFHVDRLKVTAGAAEYARCVLCHGLNAVAGGIAPDLRASPVPLSSEAFYHIVHDGALKSRGMPQFSELNDDQLESVRHYLRQAARNSANAQSSSVNVSK